MTFARLIISIIVLVFTVGIVVMNWGSVIVNARNKKKGVERHYSTVPVVSLILAAIAYVVYPNPDRIWIFLFPVTDIANWRLLLLPVAVIRQAITKGKD